MILNAAVTLSSELERREAERERGRGRGEKHLSNGFRHKS
jgi:hypothetical protein